MLNRYYGWYVNTGDLAAAERALEAELQRLGREARQADHHHRVRRRHARRAAPSIADPVDRGVPGGAAGDVAPRLRPGRRGRRRAGLELRRLRHLPGVMRVDGNKKGVFTRDRRPKAVRATCAGAGGRDDRRRARRLRRQRHDSAVTAARERCLDDPQSLDGVVEAHRRRGAVMDGGPHGSVERGVVPGSVSTWRASCPTHSSPQTPRGSRPNRGSPGRPPACSWTACTSSPCLRTRRACRARAGAAPRRRPCDLPTGGCGHRRHGRAPRTCRRRRRAQAAAASTSA